MICWPPSDAYGDIWLQKSETVRVAPPQSSALHGHRGPAYGEGCEWKGADLVQTGDPGQPAPDSQACTPAGFSDPSFML